MSKKWMGRVVLIFLLLCSATAPDVLADSGPVEMSIVYSNNIIGQIEPCPT